MYVYMYMQMCKILCFLWQCARVKYMDIFLLLALNTSFKRTWRLWCEET